MTARELKPFLPLECAGRADRSSSGAGSRWTPPDRAAHNHLHAIIDDPKEFPKYQKIWKEIFQIR
jgi:hypothetical protein